MKCPKCGNTKGIMEGPSTQTCAYYPPIYEDGVNVNPDRNVSTTSYTCLKCNHTWKEKCGLYVGDESDAEFYYGIDNDMIIMDLEGNKCYNGIYLPKVSEENQRKWMHECKENTKRDGEISKDLIRWVLLKLAWEDNYDSEYGLALGHIDKELDLGLWEKK
jgi:hypothetical protein